MNYWKVVWNSYDRVSSRKAFWRSLWSLATWIEKASFAGGLIVTAYWLTLPTAKQESALGLLIMGIAAMCVVGPLEAIRGKRFSDAYGSDHDVLAPAEEAILSGRYLIFRKSLKDAEISKSHAQDAIEILDSKQLIDLQRNEGPKKVAIYFAGMLSTYMLAQIKDKPLQDSAPVLLGVLLLGALLMTRLWLMPSRRERNLELRHFLTLFLKDVA